MNHAKFLKDTQKNSSNLGKSTFNQEILKGNKGLQIEESVETIRLLALFESELEFVLICVVVIQFLVHNSFFERWLGFKVH